MTDNKFGDMSKYGSGTPTSVTRKGAEVEGIEDMTDDILLCRLNHVFVWRYDFDVETNVDGEVAEFKRFFVCPRCKTEKIEVCDRDFEVKRRKMNYGPGYLLKKPEGGTRGRIRKATIRKAHFTSKTKNRSNNFGLIERNVNNDNNDTGAVALGAVPDHTDSSVPGRGTEGGQGEGEEVEGPVQRVSEDERLDSEQDDPDVHVPEPRRASKRTAVREG